MKPRDIDFLFSETGCISREVLLQYRDHALADAEKHAIEEHLVDCPLCSDALEGLEGVDTGVLAEVEEGVRRISEHHTKPVSGVWRAAAVIAGLSLITYVAFLQFGDIGEERMALNRNDAPPAESESPLTIHADDGVAGKPESENGNGQSALESQSVNDMEDAPDAATSGVAEDPQHTQAQDTENESLRMTAPRESAPASAAFSGINAVPQEAAPAGERIETGEQAAVTYIDNRKVVDYTLEESKQVYEADKPRTIAKQPNRKKEPPAAVEPGATKFSDDMRTYRDEIADAIALFNKGRYESAIREFNRLLENNPGDQNALFYSALSQYHLKAYEQAVTGLSGFANNRQSPFYEEGRYYYAMALLQTEEKEKGMRLLSEIAGGSGPFRERAGEALKK